MGWCVMGFVVYGTCYIKGAYDNIIIMKFPLLLYLGFLGYALGCSLGSSGGFTDKFKDLTRKEEKSLAGLRSFFPLAEFGGLA